MTVDEELNALDDAVRRLKVEYDVYFGGGSKKPPEDSEWRVKSLIKRYMDSQKLNFAQRFKYNGIVQRYAIFSELWRQKMRIKEEGYRRPADALLAIQGLRSQEEHAAAEALGGRNADADITIPFRVRCSTVESEPEKLQNLFRAMVEAKKSCGQPLNNTTNLDSFMFFIRLKTEHIRRDYGCRVVEYSVEVQDGQVKLKASPKD